MRWHLLNTFDTIYIIDLHGNALKKEVSPDGSIDKNVFDIQQGVSINLFIKKKGKKEVRLADVKHIDLYGSREFKYETLTTEKLQSLKFENIICEHPYYFFCKKNNEHESEYEDGFKVSEFYNLNNIGICSQRDKIAIQFDRNSLEDVLKDISILDVEDFRSKYKERPDGRDWKVKYAKDHILNFGIKDNFIKKINYRVFDKRWTYFSNKSKGFIAYPRYEIFKHLISGENFSLVLPRQLATNDFCHIFITEEIFDQCYISNLTKEGNYSFPLYLYPETNGQQSLDGHTERTPNFDKKLIEKFAKGLKLKFTPEKTDQKGTFAPIDVLDYIYAVLHSPAYREKYKEFLKIDFPRVPFPTDETKFWQLVALGGQLRLLHLLESEDVDTFITTYPKAGTNEVEKPRYDDGKVWINEEQYFDGVPQTAWEFYIGGYQPAQKWLKDRKGRTLSFEDIRHYQQMIVALNRTAELMQEIDAVGVVE